MIFFGLYALDLHAALSGQNAGAQHIPAALRSRELIRVVPATQLLPEEIVYKLSYQRAGRPSEGNLFSRFLGQFGVIDVIGYHTCSSEESFDSTVYLFPNPRFLVRPSEYLHCTAMAPEGLPLLDILDIPTPAELLKTILHSMIGD
jgi:hypothetical protein